MKIQTLYKTTFSKSYFGQFFSLFPSRAALYEHIYSFVKIHVFEVYNEEFFYDCINVFPEIESF